MGGVGVLQVGVAFGMGCAKRRDVIHSGQKALTATFLVNRKDFRSFEPKMSPVLNESCRREAGLDGLRFQALTAIFRL